MRRERRHTRGVMGTGRAGVYPFCGTSILQSAEFVLCQKGRMFLVTEDVFTCHTVWGWIWVYLWLVVCGLNPAAASIRQPCMARAHCWWRLLAQSYEGLRTAVLRMALPADMQRLLCYACCLSVVPGRGR